jgi:alpha-glucosidase (family GH31 glycosyl hydrolase)
MLGPSLLVAPVFVPEDEETEYYIPAGRWTSLFHPERVIQGPTWVQEVVPIDEIPVWVRPGSALLLGPAGVGRPDYPLAKNLELWAFELQDGQTVNVDAPTGEGTQMAGTISVSKQNDRVSIESKGVHIISGTEYAGGQRRELEIGNN